MTSLLRQSSVLLVAILISIAISVLVMINVTTGVMRVALALPLVFVLPGYALLASVLPRRIEERLKLALVPALSMAVVLIDGLFLNVSGLGLTDRTWTFSLATIVGFLSIIGIARRNRPASGGAYTLLRLRPSLNSVALFAIALIILTLAFFVAQEGIRQQPVANFTQLSMLPVQDNASQIQVEILNKENAPVVYRLVVMRGEQLVKEWRDIPLAAGENWDNSLTIPASAANPLRAVLYRQSAPNDIYRTATLWLKSSN